MSRPSNERDGECVCDYGPNTDGPQEECPFHGRPYAYWIERGDALAVRLEAVEALLARGDTRTLDDIDEPAVLISDLREAMTKDGGGERG